MRHSGASSIDALVLMKDGFLDDPGCEPDFEEIETIMGTEDMPEREMLSAWFDKEAMSLRGQVQLQVYRHVTVPDFDEFVCQVADGDEMGDHWSDNPDTWSHYADALGCNVRISGTIMTEDVDWYTTFQRRLAFPAERELVFYGPVAVTSVRNLDDDLSWNPTSGSTSNSVPKP